MALQWFELRIGEEQERREREARTLSILPDALQDLNRELRECIDAYKEAFGKDTAEIHFYAGKIRIRVNEQRNGKWEAVERVDVSAAPSPALPGLKIERGESEPELLEIGLLPGDKLYFRQADQFLNTEELTRKILDRVLFPKLS